MHLSRILFYIAPLLVLISCKSISNQKELTQQIFATEKAFEKMVNEHGIAHAFQHFADSNAVLKRQNDSLIRGKSDIFAYYSGKAYQNVALSWTPEYIDVAKSGDMAYSYGKYLWQTQDSTGSIKSSTGVYFTVWKKQADNTWRYVWD